MNDAVLPYLRCPNCSSALAATGGFPGPRGLRCVRGHGFDIAKQGYATLLTGPYRHAGDSAEMVADRAEFLTAGHFGFVAHALVKEATALAEEATTLAEEATTLADEATTLAEEATALADEATPVAQAGDAGLILDAGTGTGYYLSAVLDALPHAAGLGLDVSKPALRRAARAHPRASAALADLWRPLPLADSSATLILDVFSPRNGPEFRRVLRPGGALLVVTPAADHLAELIGAHGLIRVDPDKARRVGGSLRERFAVESIRTLRRQMRLDAAAVRTLIGMTPSARHLPLDALTTEGRTVTAAVDLTVYRPI